MLDTLAPKQAASVLEATARLNLWHGSVRSGKTVASQVAWIRFILHGPPGDLLMIGKTERTLRRNVLNPMLQILGSNRMQIQQGSGEARILGRLVYLAGANDERAETKIRGLTLAGSYGDEITTWPQSLFMMRLSRLSLEGAQAFDTTNPDAPLHWLKTEFIDRAEALGVRTFHFTVEDNPFLSESYKSALRSEYTGLWYKRYYQGLWVAAEGAVYDALDTDRHGIRSVPDDVTLGAPFVGVDYGTANPFVALLIAKGSDGRYYVTDEWRHDSHRAKRQMTDAQYAAALCEWLGRHECTGATLYVDPSAASFITQARHVGLSALAADNDVLDGIRVVSTLIAGDKLRFVRPNTDATLDELSGYSWDARKQQRGEDAPVKQQDHGPDALRYPLYTRTVSPSASFFEEAEEYLRSKREAARA